MSRLLFFLGTCEVTGTALTPLFSVSTKNCSSGPEVVAEEGLSRSAQASQHRSDGGKPWRVVASLARVGSSANPGMASCMFTHSSAGQGRDLCGKASTQGNRPVMKGKSLHLSEPQCPFCTAIYKLK